MPSVTREFDWDTADTTRQTDPQSDALADPTPIQPDVIIYRIGTGYAVRGWDDSIELANNDLDMLWAVADICCDLGGRYSAQRLHINYVPGDKHHDVHMRPCTECDCACDPPIVTRRHTDPECVPDNPSACNADNCTCVCHQPVCA